MFILIQAPGKAVSPSTKPYEGSEVLVTDASHHPIEVAEVFGMKDDAYELKIRILFPEQPAYTGRVLLPLSTLNDESKNLLARKAVADDTARRNGTVGQPGCGTYPLLLLPQGTANFFCALAQPRPFTVRGVVKQQYPIEQVELYGKFAVEGKPISAKVVEVSVAKRNRFANLV